MAELNEYQLRTRDRLETRANQLESEVDDLRNQIEKILGDEGSGEFYNLLNLFRQYDRTYEDFIRADERLDEFHHSYL